jgi:UDP-GlcNAc3NAcA epimerase
VYDVGDIMRDAIELFRERVPRDAADNVAHAAPGEYVLATIHRAENTDDAARLRSILSALAGLEKAVVLPLHPRTRRKLLEAGVTLPGNIRAVEPLGYLEMIALEGQAACIVTDSGGVQKEAYYLGVPCVTARDETEWVETVEVGWNVLVGADTGRLESAVRGACSPLARTRPRPTLYGDGRAAERIVDILSARVAGRSVGAV